MSRLPRVTGKEVVSALKNVVAVADGGVQEPPAVAGQERCCRMAWRFRKSIKIAKGVRLNLSKRGIGVSVGGKGFRVGIGPRGAYTSTSIPGTGLYNIEYFGRSKKRSRKPTAQAEPPAAEAEAYECGLPPELAAGSASTALGCLWVLASAVLLFVWWPVGLAGLAAFAVWAMRSLKSPEAEARACYMKGRDALDKGEWQQALEAFLKVLELKPEVLSLYREIGLLYRRLGRPEEAVKCFEKYLEGFPGDTAASLNYAGSLVNCQRYQEAVEAVQGLDPEARESLPALNILAAAFLGLNQPELALAVLEKGPVRSRKPLDEQAKLFRYLLGLTYKELGQTDKALKQFYKIYAEDSGYEDVQELVKELNPSFDKGGG